jgi:BirA family transcriptional regulator, biotin operon repressor / biotin---[acetyl-CoA-carboxylase] ligase
MFSKEELQSGLNTKIFGRKLFVYDSIDSTNSCAKVLANGGIEEGAIVIADHQTEGRGRQGRSWQSEPGCNLLFSLIIRPSVNINSVGLLPFFAAAGVAIAIEMDSGILCECKWPNDVLLNGKKFCGILMESAFQNNMLDYAVVGIGLNVNQRSFKLNLEKKATSLSIEFKRELDRITIFQSIIKSLDSLYTEVRSGNFEIVLKEWKARASIFGKQIILIQAGEKIEGKASALMADGGLAIGTSSGQRVCYSGDIIITG